MIDIFKIPDLRSKIIFTIWMCLICRIATYIPLSGINPSVMSELARSSSMLGLLNIFSGGALERFSIVSLGLSPYITSSIFIQLLGAFIPSIKALRKDGEAGQRIINQYTRYLTVVLTILQAYGIAILAESVTNASFPLVLEVGLFFKLSTIISILVGTLVLMWIGEQITSRGLGQGTSVIIYIGILSGLPSGIFKMIEIGQNGSMSNFLIISLVILSTLLLIIFFERSYRNVPIIYPQRAMSKTQISKKTAANLPIKLNVSSVLPAIFANMIIFMPMSILNYFSENNILMVMFQKYIPYGSISFMCVTGLLIFVFAFLYAPVSFNPNDIADNLKSQHSHIKGIRPGKDTADFLYNILMRITLIGASYLLVIAILPELIISSVNTGQRLFISGTSLLIVVSITIDLVSHIYSYVTYNKYKDINRLI